MATVAPGLDARRSAPVGYGSTVQTSAMRLGANPFASKKSVPPSADGVHHVAHPASVPQQLKRGLRASLG